VIYVKSGCDAVHERMAGDVSNEILAISHELKADCISMGVRRKEDVVPEFGAFTTYSAGGAHYYASPRNA
jgi:hypothetical protein